MYHGTPNGTNQPLPIGISTRTARVEETSNPHKDH